MRAISPQNGKLEFLDGLRALMAFNVILNHFVVVYYPQMYYLEYAEEIGGVLSLFATTPLSVFLNGNIAVQYFFVLTGFLAGRIVFTKELTAENIPPRMLNRYFRLLPVVAAATLFTFFTMRFDLQRHLDIADLVANTWFLPDYCNFTERLISLPSQIFLDPFTPAGSNYVGPFWTIRYEFLGYGIAMLTCLVLKNRKSRHLEYFVVAFFLSKEASSHYIPFVLGALVADLQYNNAPCFRFFGRSFTSSKKTLGIFFLVGAYLACCPIYFTGLYAWLANFFGMNTERVRAAGIALLLYVLINMPKMQKPLSHLKLVSLGELSFELYGFHWPIMLSFQAWLFSVFIGKMSYDAAALAAFVGTLPVIYIVSRLVHTVLGKLSRVFVYTKKRIGMLQK